MKEIRVSTEVYAAIWRNFHQGDATEDDILRRCLNVQEPRGAEKIRANLGDGFQDARNGVHFAEGFIIFRLFKGFKYEAVATEGSWQLKSDGRTFNSLNRLTWAVTDNSVNAWEFWKFHDSDNKERKINDLRREEVVVKRR